MRKSYAERFNVVTFTAAYMGVEASLNRKLIFNAERSKITLEDVKKFTKPDKCIDLSAVIPTVTVYMVDTMKQA